MGGNIRVVRDNIVTWAQQVPLSRIGRTEFCSCVKGILYDISEHLNCWSTDSIESGEIFSGSSQYVFSPEYTDKEIAEVKKSIGDVDVMIDIDFKDQLTKYLDYLSDSDFKGYVYNKKIDQIHSVFNVLGVNCQIDFEFTKFSGGKPSEFAKFSHSSSFTDAQYNIKAVFHKFLIGATTYTTSQNILVLDSNGNSVNEDKTKFAVFSVVDGFKIKYKPLYDKSRHEFVRRHGLQVFVKNKSPYSTNVKRFYKYLFNTDFLEDYEKFWSFIGVCELIKEAFSRDKINDIHSKFCEMLQNHRVSKNADEDRKLKYNAYLMFINKLGFYDYFWYLGI